MSKCSLVLFCDSEKEKYPPLLGSKMMESCDAEKARDHVVLKRDGHQVAPRQVIVIILESNRGHCTPESLVTSFSDDGEQVLAVVSSHFEPGPTIVLFLAEVFAVPAPQVQYYASVLSEDQS